MNDTEKLAKCRKMLKRSSERLHAVERLLEAWKDYGPGSSYENAFGPQKMTVVYAIAQLEDALRGDLDPTENPLDETDHRDREWDDGHHLVWSDGLWYCTLFGEEYRGTLVGWQGETMVPIRFCTCPKED